MEKKKKTNQILFVINKSKIVEVEISDENESASFPKRKGTKNTLSSSVDLLKKFFSHMLQLHKALRGSVVRTHTHQDISRSQDERTEKPQ